MLKIVLDTLMRDIKSPSAKAAGQAFTAAVVKSPLAQKKLMAAKGALAANLPHVTARRILPGVALANWLEESLQGLDPSASAIESAVVSTTAALIAELRRGDAATDAALFRALGLIKPFLA